MIQLLENSNNFESLNIYNMLLICYTFTYKTKQTTKWNMSNF